MLDELCWRARSPLFLLLSLTIHRFLSSGSMLPVSPTMPCPAIANLLPTSRRRIIDQGGDALTLPLLQARPSRFELRGQLSE